MKRLSTILVLVLAIVVSSCKYDDTLVWNSIDELKQRMSALETVMKAYENNLFIESIDEIDNGYIITFSDGSKATIVDGENGKDGADGKDGINGTNGKDGETYIDNISIEGDKVTFTLTDGTMFSIPLYSTFDIIFESTEGLICYPGVSVEVGYTVIGAIGDVSIECFGNGGWDAMIEDGDGTSGKIKVTAPKDDSAEQGKIVVIALSGGNNICMKSIYFDKGVIIDILDNYEVDCYPGHLEVNLRTNIDYNVIIPEDAQSWLHLIDTRTTLRDGVIAFEYDDNNSQDIRTATIQLISEDGDALYCFEIIQKGNKLSGNIVFADSNVKLACLDKYDIDCNGELSYAEALKVTKIPRDFLSNYKNSVKAFDEFKYFANVKNIEGGAFNSCSNLISISFPENVESIGDDTFVNCKNLNNICISNIKSWCNIKFATNDANPLHNGGNLYIDNQLATTIIIPSGISSLGSYTFYNCSSLTSVTIPDGVTSIGRNAFGNCSSLSSVTISDSVVSIGNSAFYGCSSLTSITIPNGVTSIGDYAFFDCSSLTSITIPDGVTSIGDDAFRNCESLTSVNIPDSVTSIGVWAFAYCTSLTSVNIPDGVTSIGDYAFYSCSSLTSITIPDSVVSIGGYAFIHCRSLKEIYCKSTTPPTGGYNMFYNNASGRKIYVPIESVEAYKAASEWSAYADDIYGYDFENNSI